MATNDHSSDILDCVDDIEVLLILHHVNPGVLLLLLLLIVITTATTVTMMMTIMMLRTIMTPLLPPEITAYVGLYVLC